MKKSLQKIGLLLAIFGWSTVAAAQGPPAGPVVWGQQSFVIPYQWTNASDPMNARAVELYSSSDRGRSWQKISDALPSVRYFTYRAPSDGEYWFAIRTIDQQGTAWPAEPMRAELQVVVDTQSPQIVRLEGTIDATGQVTATWQAHDAFLDPASWSLRYRTEQMSDWQSVTPTAPGQQSPNQMMGQATWTVPAGTGRVWLQAQVRDQAGNSREQGAIALATMQPTGPLAAVPGSSPSATNGPSFPATNVGSAPQFGLINSQSSPSQTPKGDPFAAAANSVPPSVPPVDAWPASQPAINAPSAPDTAREWPADRLAASPYENNGARPALPQFDSSLSISQPASPPLSPVDEFSTPSRTGAQFASMSPGEPPELANVPTSPTFNGQVDQYVNDLEFDIDYQVDRAGTFGVSKVELWATRDGGRSWRRLAIDSDNVSPIRAQVPEPGDYGLRIVVETAGGLDPRTPRPGDRPELTLRVDATRPQAELLDIRQGESYFADHLIITWRASDADLTATPISLSYSSRPNGPWIPLATGLANTGRYSWRLQRHLPTQIYLRLEATDRAGNVATSTTPGPIAVHLPIPTGQLQGVRGVAP